MNEEALIEAAQNGDVHAYNRLVLHYEDALYRTAYHFMGEQQSAEDAVQNAFIKAYKALNKFQGGNFQGWLTTIAANICRDELRKHKRRPQSSLDELTEDNESFTFLRSDNPTPEEEHQQLEMMRAIEHCLHNLPDDQRITAVLCDVEGYDYNEIAKITAVSLGTVKSRMNRARQKLRDCLQGFGELLPLSYRL